MVSGIEQIIDSLPFQAVVFGLPFAEPIPQKTDFEGPLWRG